MVRGDIRLTSVIDILIAFFASCARSCAQSKIRSTATSSAVSRTALRRPHRSRLIPPREWLPHLGRVRSDVCPDRPRQVDSAGDRPGRCPSRALRWAHCNVYIRRRCAGHALPRPDRSLRPGVWSNSTLRPSAEPYVLLRRRSHPMRTSFNANVDLPHSHGPKSAAIRLRRGAFRTIGWIISYQKVI
jgi:hypothetical protein